MQRNEQAQDEIETSERLCPVCDEPLPEDARSNQKVHKECKTEYSNQKRKNQRDYKKQLESMQDYELEEKLTNLLSNEVDFRRQQKKQLANVVQVHLPRVHGMRKHASLLTPVLSWSQAEIDMIRRIQDKRASLDFANGRSYDNGVGARSSPAGKQQCLQVSPASKQAWAAKQASQPGKASHPRRSREEEALNRGFLVQR